MSCILAPQLKLCDDQHQHLGLRPVVSCLFIQQQPSFHPLSARLLLLPGLLPLGPRLNPRHHLLLGNQVIDALQQAQQALHVEAPLIQRVVGVARLGEADDALGTVDLGVDRLGRDELTDVLFRLVLRQVQQLRQALRADPRVVLGDHAHVVLDHALAQVLPALRGLRVRGLGRGGGVEDFRGAEVRAKELGDFGPAHELVDREELEELGVVGDLRVARVLVDAVEEVVLLVVVGGKNHEVDDSLEDLGWGSVGCLIPERGGRDVPRGASRGPVRPPPCPAPAYSACTRPGTWRHAWPARSAARSTAA